MIINSLSGSVVPSLVLFSSIGLMVANCRKNSDNQSKKKEKIILAYIGLFLEGRIRVILAQQLVFFIYFASIIYQMMIFIQLMQ